MEIFNADFAQQLPEEIICEEAERVISTVLSVKFGFKIFAEVEYRDENPHIGIWGYKQQGLDVSEVTLSPKEIDRKAVNLIRNRLNRALSNRVALIELRKFRSEIGSVARGEVTKIDDASQEVTVEISDGELQSWLARYPMMEQPQRERGDYRVGQVLLFCLTKIEIVDDGGAPRLDIIVSRRSAQMVTGMFYNVLEQMGEDTTNLKIKCWKRIPGAYSNLRTNRKIPGAAIAKVATELKEKMKVEYNDPSRPRKG